MTKITSALVQDIAIWMLKLLVVYYTGIIYTYMSDLFVLRNNVRNLRGTNKLVPCKKTRNVYLKPASFTGGNVWRNSLPAELRSPTIVN